MSAPSSSSRLISNVEHIFYCEFRHALKLRAFVGSRTRVLSFRSPKFFHCASRPRRQNKLSNVIFLSEGCINYNWHLDNRHSTQLKKNLKSSFKIFHNFGQALVSKILFRISVKKSLNMLIGITFQKLINFGIGCTPVFIKHSYIYIIKGLMFWYYLMKE
jgi:hypothetical protein